MMIISDTKVLLTSNSRLDKPTKIQDQEVQIQQIQVIGQVQEDGEQLILIQYLIGVLVSLIPGVIQVTNLLELHTGMVCSQYTIQM